MAISLSSASIHAVSCFNSVKVASFAKPFSIRATSASSLDYSSASVTENRSIRSSSVAVEVQRYDRQYPLREFEKDGSEPSMNILLVPTLSDVSTMNVWRLVAKDIVERDGRISWHWPGLGYSDWPKLNYVADVMENFLVNLVNAPDSPVSSSGRHSI